MCQENIVLIVPPVFNQLYSISDTFKIRDKVYVVQYTENIHLLCFYSETDGKGI